MTSIAENKRYYQTYDWSMGGAEWSTQWGSTSNLWKFSLQPRLAQFLPAARVVEIGCGHGRIAAWLRHYSLHKLYLFDIMDHCVDACRNHFAANANVDCTLTDGQSLTGIEDNSIDLIVSFYSLVHADEATIRGYIDECARVLKEDGVAFIHHSNAGQYYKADQFEHDRSQQLLAMYRDVSISAASMRKIADESGFHCLRQECINWDIDEVLSDCFSTLIRKNSNHDVLQGHCDIESNYTFVKEMTGIKSGQSRGGISNGPN